MEEEAGEGQVNHNPSFWTVDSRLIETRCTQNMTTEIALDALRTFNRKWDKIASYSFLSTPTYIKHRHQMIGSGGESYVDSNYPSEEQIDAVILNLRFFTQTNEPCSHHKISMAYSTLNIDASIVEGFASALNDFKVWWQSPCGYQGMTNCRLFNVFVHGDAAHRNDLEKVKTRDELARKSEEDLVFALCKVVHDMMRYLGPIYYHNKKALEAYN